MSAGRRTDTWTDDECEAYTRDRQQSTPREADEAADRAWGDRLGQMDAVVEDGDRVMGWGK